MKRISARLPFLRRYSAGLVIVAMVGLLASCSGLQPPVLPTALPPDYIPTAVALTLTASGIKPEAPSATEIAAFSPKNEGTRASSTVQQQMATQTTPETSPATATVPLEPASSSTLLVSIPATNPETSQIFPATGTPTPSIDTATSIEPGASPTNDSALDPATHTPPPAIPDARIQIYRLGDLSKVVSPLDVSLKLTCGEARIVRIELNGEDGRLLARYVREYQSMPWEAARIGISMDFEISAAAELGRLIVSAEDAFGRTIEVNSMNLILLSQGTTELNPSSGLQQQIIFQDPTEKALIQNGSLIVSGRAHTESLEPLRVLLISEEGKVLGQRLAAVTTEIPGDYGQFITELPYEVKEITPALLVVYEESNPLSTITHLTSLNVTLVPK